MHMLAIYWEPKSAFQNTFCRYSTITISKHNNSTTEKPSWHLSLRYSWAPVTVPEALPALRPGKCRYLSGICLGFVWSLSGILPVFVRSFSGTLCQDFTGQVPARLIEPKILFTQSSIKTKNYFWASSWGPSLPRILPLVWTWAPNIQYT